MGASRWRVESFFKWLVQSSETLPLSEGLHGSISGLCHFGTHTVFRKH
jgi:hypothetical protein